MVEGTTSTLAGEYVTAQELVGDTGGLSKIWDKNTLYKDRAKRKRSDEGTGENGGKTLYEVQSAGG